MTSPRVRPVLLALLGILAIAVAAATLNSAVAVDGDFGFGSGDGIGDGDGERPGATPPASTPPNASAGSIPFAIPCVAILTDPTVMALGGLLIVGGLALLHRWKGPHVSLGVVLLVGPPALLVYLLLTGCSGEAGGESESPALLNRTNPLPSGMGEGGGGATGVLTSPSLLLLGALGAVLLVAVALLVVSSDDQLLDTDEEPEPEAESESLPTAIGRAAGRAADRIEDTADLDNEVYRAWHEMTTYLDVPNPESSSPGEFADVAVEAGMDREDVSRLTRLFEEVRYGAAEPTSDREERAIDALRRIEDRYAEDEP